ncbi:MAG: hypothetical protein D6767_01880 [Candidatus Hydrogenedentota bacterium]|nr:MAG: hypothetical protein D6767_01880 [Candidatus Hydrogenedentota bacterium]
MKKWFLIYTVVSLVFIGLDAYWLMNKKGGEEGEAITSKKPLDIKTIRQNPGSFRSHYLPYMIYTGGK